MKDSDIAAVEAELGIKLPPGYRAILSGPDAKRLDKAGLFDDAALIIQRTKEQRAGFGGASPWPVHFVYIGDQEDACPYALDVTSGSITQTDHGNLAARPLARYATTADLAAELLKE